MATQPTQRIINWLAPVGFFTLIIAAWEFLVRVFSVPQYLLPTPSAIAVDFASSINSLLFHAGITLWEAFLGFLLANALGILLAIAFAHSKTLEKGFYPFAIALKTTPIIAMAPLLILWFGNGIASKVAAAALIAFFPAIVNTTKGLKSIDSEALDLFKSLSASKWQIFSKLRFPTALPYIFSALKISTSLAVVGAIVGEFVGANKGIGFVILVSSYHLEIVKMFSAVIAAALTGIIFFWVVSFIEKRVVFWTTLEE
jgi:NitT/TauT family transport system permease protein